MSLSGQSLEALQQQKKVLQRDLQENNRLLEANQMALGQSRHRVALLNRQMTLRQSLVGQLELEIAVLDERLHHQESVLEGLGIDLAQKQQDYAGHIQQLYQRRKRGSALLFVFSANSFGEAWRRYRYLMQLASFRKTQGEIIQQTRQDLFDAHARLAVERKVRHTRLQDAETAKEALAVESQLLNREQAALQRKDRSLRKQIDHERQRTSLITAEIDQLIAAGKGLAGKEFSKAKGRLPRPVKGVITGRFGVQRTGEVRLDNKGVDFSVAKGTKAKAVAPGVVLKVFGIKHSGKAVIVDHGGYFTVYAYLGGVVVDKGDQVQLGTVLGPVASRQGESVMHFELWKTTTPQNPEQWFK